MANGLIIMIVAIIAFAAFIAARSRALASVGGDKRKLHSLPSYYGNSALMLTIAPAALLLAVWLVIQPFIVNGSVSDIVQDRVEEGTPISLILADVRRVANGIDLLVQEGGLTSDEAANLSTETTDIREKLAEIGMALGSDVAPSTLEAAQRYRVLAGRGNVLKAIAVIGVAFAGAVFGILRSEGNFRARNVVERGVLWILIGAASIAILTTVGIVLSLIFNTIEFFQLYPASEFFGGLRWNPSFSGRGGGSELGILPLLWGTLYISFIALVVAVPVGLFAAIYLSEYASRPVRAFAKPMLEILAGIPTIVYGLFALLTVGPLLVSAFGNGGLFGVSWMAGGTAVMTAGLVMGVMLIPFVSSLSDDIINAVPQAMRDGSLGLGATQSETVRQVILPAALPGIVGAILLAASRAIGETMIVVLGAGAAARLSLNPFEAMTTVTAKIVSQLTGDSDFASPEALVAFALGITLFVITLGLNIFALYIVRKYREQYE